jgi:hypothetical protein
MDLGPLAPALEVARGHTIPFYNWQTTLSCSSGQIYLDVILNYYISPHLEAEKYKPQQWRRNRIIY